MSSPNNTKSNHTDAQAPPATTNAQVAHELANLLDGSMRNVNLVRSFLKEQAASELPADPDVTNRLQSAEQGMRQMATLLRKWLQASHFDPSASPVFETAAQNEADQTGESNSSGSSGTTEFRTASIGHVADMAQRLVMPQMREHSIDLVRQIDPDAADLPAGALYHVIANAFRNATDAIIQSRTPVESPCIELSIFPDREHIVIQVDDNGPGIAPEMLDKHGDCRIGETSKPDGHGIGLSLCRDIAESLGGSFRLTNRLPQGAKFTMRFPASALLD